MGWSDSLDLLWELQAAYAIPERAALIDRRAGSPAYKPGAALLSMLTGNVEPVWVDADTCTLLTYAASPDAGLDAADGLAESDVFTPKAFCLFETPIPIAAGSDGDPQPDTVALSWEVEYSGVWFSVWEHYTGRILPHRLSHTDPALYAWGRSMEEPGERAIMTLFLLAHQFEPARGRERVARATRRRGERRGRTIPTVTVIRLPRRRGATGTDDGGYRMEHDHRWWVRPHWRRQWYAKQQRHRPILIAGHARGPADKPLVVKDRAWEVKRPR